MYYYNTVNIHTELDAYPLTKIKTLVNLHVIFDLKRVFYQVTLCEDNKLFTAFETIGLLYKYTWILFWVTNIVATF